MNADDTAKPPANGSFLPPNANATPPTGSQPVRREGILPTSGAQPTTGSQAAPAPTSGTMPQRTAFRPTTGVAPSGAQPTTGSAPQAAGNAQSAQAASHAPATQRPSSAGAPPSISPTSAGQRPQFQPTGGSSTPTTGNAPARTGLGTAAGATGTAAATTAAASASATATETAPSGGALSVGDRFKALAGKATDTTKTQLEKAETARKVEASTGPRKARVLVSRVDPWSALKIGFLLSIAAGIMTVVAMHILWNVLNSMGTFAMIQEWVSRLFTEESELNILQFVEYSKVMSATLLIAVVNVFLLTGLATISALLYNMISRVVGGVYVTLTDD